MRKETASVTVEDVCISLKVTERQTERQTDRHVDREIKKQRQIKTNRQRDR